MGDYKFEWLTDCQGLQRKKQDEEDLEGSRLIHDGVSRQLDRRWCLRIVEEDGLGACQQAENLKSKENIYYFLN